MKKIIIFTVILCIKIFFSQCLTFAQQDTTAYMLSGAVSNEKDKKLRDVKVTAVNSYTSESKTTHTDSKGEYSFSLKNGVYEITAGIEEFTTSVEKNILINGADKKLNLFLAEKIYTTDQIDVEGIFRQNQDDLRTSLQNISPKNVKILPGAIEDVMRSLKSLPGVTSPNDFTSQLVIRGSGPDQNLIIMDDVEIFNPYRLYGLVSMFNPETLNDISLITGGFPAKYGDRLSAVLDVMNKEGSRDKFLNISSNISIASANVILQGKLPLSVPGSWIVSSRRTYYDLILGPFAKNAGLITEDSQFPNFEDIQFKLAFGPFKRHKLFVNGIFSKDGVDVISGKDRTIPDSVNVNDVTKNDVVSLSWHYFPGSNFVSRTTLSYYKNTGDNQFEGDIIDPLIDKENLTPGQRDSLKAIGALFGLNFDSKYFFRKISLGNRSFLLAGKNKYEFGGGVDIIRTDLTYKLRLDDKFKSFLRSLPGVAALLDDFNLNGNDNLRANIYAQGRFTIGKKFFYQPSFRVDYYSYLKKYYFSPRINFGYILDPLTTVRFATGFYYQSPGYEKLVDNQTFYDLTGEKGANLKAERAFHYVLGVERWLNNEWQAKVEGYYKKLDNLIIQEKLPAYKYTFGINDPYNKDPNYIKNPANWSRSLLKSQYDSLTTNPINGGTGNAYGIELSLEKKYMSPKTKFYGWVNYALSFADRTRDGLTLPFRYDQRHVVNIVLNYKVNTWFELGAHWTYATNFPYTKPLGITPRVLSDTLVVNPLTNQLLFNLDYGTEADRFSEQRPAYHRLDMRFTAFTKFWNVDWSFYLDVINVYNRKNIIGYQYSLTSDLQIKQQAIGMIPILPTLGVSAKF